MKLTWQQQLEDIITDPKELLRELGLDFSLLRKNLLPLEAGKGYPLKVPRSFVSRMRKNDSNDPLLRQILPQLSEEILLSADFKEDPLEETRFTKVPGLLHKYFGRILLLITSDCPVNCRFCFRKFHREQIVDWKQIYAYIGNDETISEVILSGGEPLLLENETLHEMINNFAKIPHVRRLRIHTRLPILIPARIDEKLADILSVSRLKPVVVIHCNHPNEINDEVAEGLQILRKKNITLLNQSVLLKRVNDSAEILAALCEKLFAIGVLPYYLHVLDKVSGAFDFEVEITKAQAIYREMAQVLPGYLVPKLVADEVNATSKTLLG
jgi:EF-P beta-lysylation protein EpmB